MQENLIELSALLSMPRVQAEPVDWDEVTRRLGSRLPEDYTDLIDNFGGGWVDDHIGIYVPGCANHYFDLVPAGKQRIADLEGLWAEEENATKPPQLAGFGRYLINWASTGSGEYLYWIADESTPPEKWTVSLEQGRDGDWEHFDVGCVDFLLGVLSGRVDSFYLSDLADEDEHGYEAIGED